MLKPLLNTHLQLENNYSIDRRTRSGLPSDTPMPGPATNLPNQAHRQLNRVSKAVVWVALAVFALPAVTQAKLPLSQKHEIRHEIDQLEDLWRSAVLKGNPTMLESLLADDYIAITASGTLQNKQQTLDNLRQGRTKFTSLDISDRKVRFYGTTALVTSLASVEGTANDDRLAGSYRYTRVYVRNAQGTWKVVSFEASKIRETGDHADHK